MCSVSLAKGLPVIRGLAREDLSDAFQPLPGCRCCGLEELHVR